MAILKILCFKVEPFFNHCQKGGSFGKMIFACPVRGRAFQSKSSLSFQLTVKSAVSFLPLTLSFRRHATCTGILRPPHWPDLQT